MRCSRVVVAGLVVLAGLLLTATKTFAQNSSISGSVTDATGAVLPGVSVEARSAALIEQVRTVVTDAAGVYQIVNLRPGTYEVKFTLSGFATVARSGVVLVADFNAPINVQLRLGGVEETITVSGQSPVVDTQSTTRRLVLEKDVQEMLPTGRSFLTAMNLVPAVSTGTQKYNTSGSADIAGPVASNGGLYSDSKVLIDGLFVGALNGTGASAGVYLNDGEFQETVIQTLAGDAETQSAGVRTNLIPKQGGNTFHGELVTTYANEHMQGDNLDDALLAAGVKTPVRRLQYDVNASVGGPIVRDRLWFFTSVRKWLYSDYFIGVVNADGSRPANDTDLKAFLPARLTGQLTPKNKLSISHDRYRIFRPFVNLTPTVTPAATSRSDRPFYITQARWTAPLTNRVLIDAGASNTDLWSNSDFQPGVVLSTCFVAYTACAPGTSYGDVSHQDLVTGQVSKSPNLTTSRVHFHTLSYGASVAYVTGSHAFKVGFQDVLGMANFQSRLIGDLVQRYRSGAPDSVSISNTPAGNQNNLNHDLGVYVADSWKLKRWTLTPSLRYDYFRGEIPAQDLPAGRFVPARHFDAVANLPQWRDFSPRFGAAYDLFGDAKTVVKGSVGKYVQQDGTLFPSTYNPAVAAADVRTWRDLNVDDIAQENELGPPTNTTFGVRRNRNLAPKISRPYQVLATLVVERELWSGTGLSVTYSRREFFNNIFTTNLAAPLSAYTPIGIPDPRGNGQTAIVYNLAPALNGLVNELDANSSNNRATYHGVDIALNGRWRGGTFLAGTSTGRARQIACDMPDPNGAAASATLGLTQPDRVNFLLPSSLTFCDETKLDIPFLTTLKMGGTVPLPYGMNVSAVFQNQPGEVKNIYYNVSRAVVPTLTQAAVSVLLTPPGSSYYPRVNHLDLGVAKTVKVGSIGITGKLDLFNALNANPITSVVTLAGPSLNTPVAVLNPRLFRLGATLKF